MELRISAKTAVILILTAALICTVALLAEKENETKYVQTSSLYETDPIESFRTEREQLRAMQKAQLNDIAHDSAADAETAELARRQLIDLCACEEQELTIEGILSMRGFENPVVTVHNGSVNVLVSGKTLTQQQTSVILDLVCRETGAMSGDIKIIPVN